MKVVKFIVAALIAASASIASADPYRQFEDSSITLGSTTLRECFNKQRNKIEEIDWHPSKPLNVGGNNYVQITTYEITQNSNRIFLLFRTADRVFVAVTIHYPNGFVKSLIGNDARSLFTQFCNS